jgi:hypothetical protein
VYKIHSLNPEMGYTSEREEPFYIITLEVKNKRSVAESLELFIEPEVLSGDNKIEIEIEAETEAEAEAGEEAETEGMDMIGEEGDKQPSDDSDDMKERAKRRMSVSHRPLPMKAKIDARRSCFFRKLPQILFLHLKRL